MAPRRLRSSRGFDDIPGCQRNDVVQTAPLDNPSGNRIGKRAVAVPACHIVCGEVVRVGRENDADAGSLQLENTEPLQLRRYAAGFVAIFIAMPLAYAAASVALLVYVVGFISSFWLPEPQQENLPE